VIAIIAIGGLIILGILWCIIRCACCGLSCCCECCYCLKCCGSCCGCCDPPHKKKYLDEPYIPPHHDQAYQPQAPMTAARAVPTTPTYEGSVAKPEPPQYAEFDMSKKGGVDDLPAMPSWEGANSKKVLLEEEEVELEQLKKPEPASLNAVGSTSTSVSPVSPSTPFPGAAVQNNANSGYRMPPSRSTTDPYGANGYNNYGNRNGSGSFNQSRDQLNQGYDQGYGNSGYGNQAQGYGNQGYGGAMRQEQQNPYGSDYNAAGYARGPMNQNQGYPQQRGARSYDDYGRSVTPRSGPPRMGTPGNPAYGRPAPTASPAPYGAGAYGNHNRTQSPAPSQGGYGGAAYANVNRTQSPAPSQGGYGYAQRSNTGNSYGRQYPPNPQRQYSNEVSQHTESSEVVTQYATAHPDPYELEKTQSPIQNTGGFDFTSGYSRPPTAAPNSSPPSPAPQQTTGGAAAYPGYRAYKPAQ
jgi:hypothetical protein